MCTDTIFQNVDCTLQANTRNELERKSTGFPAECKEKWMRSGTTCSDTRGRLGRMSHSSACLFLCLLSVAVSSTAIDIPAQVEQLPTITDCSSGTLLAFPLDEDFTIKCEAKGNPPPTFRWTKDGKPYNPSHDPRVLMEPHSGTFTVRNNGSISSFHGKYRCSASNEQGTAISEEIHFIVPRIPKFPNENTAPEEVEEGDPVVLQCNPPEGIPPLHIYWMTNDLVHIPQDERVSIGLDGNLYFANTEEEDSRSDYYCFAAFTSMRVIVQKNAMTLTVNTIKHSNSSQSPHAASTGANFLKERRPKMLLPRDSLSTVVIIKGSSLVLQCIAEGLPTPKLHWLKVGGDLPWDRAAIENHGKILKITEVSEDDQGTYHCTASNYLATAQHEFHVSVEAPPQWKKEPQSNAYSVGSKAILFCEATGWPEPEIRWKVNGIPIEAVELSPNHRVLPGEVSITNLQVKDSAVYQCEAVNKHGTILASANIDVLNIAPLLLTNDSKEYFAVSRTKVLLSCDVFSFPTAVISWTREESATPLHGHRFLTHDNGTLEIINTRKEDSGVYTCWVTNALGKSAITAILEIRGATQATINPEHPHTLRNHAVKLRCRTEVDPHLRKSLKLAWKKDGEELELEETEPRRIIIEADTLTILSVTSEDQGLYSCIASTSLDHTTAESQLVVLDVPDTPSNIHLSEKRNQSVQLSWKAGNSHNSPTKEFIIEYEESKWEAGKWQILTRVPGNETSADLLLTPALKYQFRVSAVNAVGRSQHSKASERYDVPPAAPDKNPDNIHVDADKPDEMIVKWEPLKPAEHNGPGLQYRVLWRQKGKQDDWEEEYTKRHWFIVKNTPTYVPYDIKVQAVNQLGFAPEPDVFTEYSGEDTPDAAPVNVAVQVLNSTLIKVTWGGIHQDRVRGHLGGYKVNWWKVRSLLDGKKHHLEKRFLTFAGERDWGMVPALEPFSDYQLSVTAFNTRGEGPASPVLAFQTPEGVPDHPRFLQIHSFEEDSVTLTWAPPKKPNGILRGYLLQHQIINDTDEIGVLNSINITNSSLVSWRISNLDSSTKYKFYLQACTSAGCGRATTEEGLTVPQASKEIWKVSEAGNAAHTFRPVEVQEPGSDYTIHLVTKNWVDNGSIFEDVIETRGRAYAEVHDGISTQGWFIGLMCAIALLTLVLLIACFVQRNKGGKYSVKEKEDLHPDLESQSIKDETFGDYSDSDEKPLKGSLESLGGEIKASVSGDSLVDYGDGDHGQFNEDGSFIGAYTGSKEKGTVDVNGSSTFPIHA
ncbi:neural cell adhesion molecule L1-like protein isoform X2 [Ambystoma mexicanum]|uniref:neural cell adhesion molecule L1-like protein isoform X2 n=1 Tax=Ambystoma mexicanum TaxID=8296 RepID=UPI0037E9BA8F